ncbi:hypothetical protein [Phorcysia thermohydrogeniphila]|uniref:Uncharacterized protein n=1 Tax=Phorcysia thermohydrogeniphila TaxID=936138 RepID=A0A4R1GQ77_9BACT|nr:hypothetical protein [Phorcysia thermohydrogeniphila]TCK06672.1 hypothetical protein CLV27_0478 [Phorcysia thermohydrogeniphila]
MRLYLGYPESLSSYGRFKLKDLFLEEVNVDYLSVPVEVKRKLLSLLENLEQKAYIFIGNVIYDAIDILEFALFSCEPRSVKELVLPGYLYGKPTFLIRNLFEKTFASKVSIYYDFNLFPPETLVLNVGYTKSSFSLGGIFLSVIPVGEFHMVDLLGNYLFNRFILEKGISNTELRKKGLRGELLDRFRSFAGKILFKGLKRVELQEYGYSREVSPKEVDLVLSPLTGSSNYGDFVERAVDLASALVLSLYQFEEILRERPKVKEVAVIGRLKFPFIKVLQRIFPVPVREVSEEELLSRSPLNRNFKVHLRRVDFPSYRELFGCETEAFGVSEVSIKDLRYFFNKRDLRGVKLIEELTGRDLSRKELESFVYELLYIMKRSSFRTKEEIAYLNHAIVALSRLSIPEELFDKVLEEMAQKAFNWLLPLKTKLNILYFCYRFADKIGDTDLKVFPPLLLSYIRDKKLSEGERNFVRTAAQSIYAVEPNLYQGKGEERSRDYGRYCEGDKEKE